MKKILFLAITVMGLHGAVMAQEGKAEGLTLPPTQAESESAAKSKVLDADRRKSDEKVKMQSLEQKENSVKMKEAKKNIAAEQVNARYKEAGLSASQITELNSSMRLIDKKIAENNNNSSLSADERAKANSNIEGERNAILKKTLGQEGYKTYMQDQKMEMVNEKTKSPQ